MTQNANRTANAVLEKEIVTGILNARVNSAAEITIVTVLSKRKTDVMCLILQMTAANKMCI